MDPTSFDELRPGTYDVQRARPRHVGQRCARLAELPVAAGLRRPALRRARRQGRRARALPRRTTTGTSKSGAAPRPTVSSRSRSRRSGTRTRSATRCAGSRRRAATRSRSPRTRCRSACPACTPTTGTRSGARAATRGRSSACTSVRRRSWRSPRSMHPIDVMIMLQPMNIVQAAADLIFSPVFRKFPDVTVALSEGGIGWIPYFLERSTTRTSTHKAWTFADFGDKLPSEVFMEHVILCFIEDDFGARQAREIGTDRICIETDYPHSDAIWPNAPERLMAGVGADRPHRRRDQRDHARERDALLPLRSVLDPPARAVHGRRVARRGRGPRHVDQSKGRRVEHDEPMTLAGVRRRPRERACSSQPRRSGMPTPTATKRPTATSSRTRRWRGARIRVPELELNVLGDVGGKEVLELGCGAAQWSIALAERGAARHRPRRLERAARLRAPGRARPAARAGER